MEMESCDTDRRFSFPPLDGGPTSSPAGPVLEFHVSFCERDRLLFLGPPLLSRHYFLLYLLAPPRLNFRASTFYSEVSGGCSLAFLFSLADRTLSIPRSLISASFPSRGGGSERERTTFTFFGPLFFILIFASSSEPLTLECDWVPDPFPPLFPSLGPSRRRRNLERSRFTCILPSFLGMAVCFLTGTLVVPLFPVW